MAKGQFWMVKGFGPTNFKHHTREEAEAEAERLARLHPPGEFVVLEAVAKFRKIDVERIDLRPMGDFDPDAEIPF